VFVVCGLRRAAAAAAAVALDLDVTNPIHTHTPTPPTFATHSDQQEREVVRVLVDCAGQEAAYNPYYAYLAGRLCEFQDRHKFTLQLTYWDMCVRWRVVAVVG